MKHSNRVSSETTTSDVASQVQDEMTEPGFILMMSRLAHRLTGSERRALADMVDVYLCLSGLLLPAFQKLNMSAAPYEKQDANRLRYAHGSN